MDLEHFNNNFPSLENEFKNIQKQNALQQKLIIQSIFSATYPDVEFDDLIKQPNDCLTDDGCTHYLDRNTNKIYSFNYIRNKWIEKSEMYQRELIKFFTNN